MERLAGELIPGQPSGVDAMHLQEFSSHLEHGHGAVRAPLIGARMTGIHPSEQRSLDAALKPDPVKLVEATISAHRLLQAQTSRRGATDRLVLFDAQLLDLR